jgi:hypothetical protein
MCDGNRYVGRSDHMCHVVGNEDTAHSASGAVRKGAHMVRGVTWT